jgi:hypothetical protein
MMPVSYVVLSYAIQPDYFEVRGPFKADHVAHVDAAVAAGAIVSAGVVGMPIRQALYVFAGEEGAARAFAEADPYVRAGVATDWSVDAWHPIAGPGAG